MGQPRRRLGPPLRVRTAVTPRLATANADWVVLPGRLGVPYFSWRISHAKHHAATSHVDRDEVYVPRTRTEMGLPPFDPKNEDVLGSSVSENLQRELWEAIGDSPIGGLLTNVAYLVNTRAIMMRFRDSQRARLAQGFRLACVCVCQR